MEEIPSQSNNQRNPGNEEQVHTPDRKDEQNRNENRKMEQTARVRNKFEIARTVHIDLLLVEIKL